MVGWFDSHCHLEMIDLEPESILEDMKIRNVSRVVSIGTCVKNNQQMFEIISKHPNCYGTTGLHPSNVTESEIDAISSFEQIISTNSKLVAIGECGYDQFRSNVSLELQETAFKLQLDLALKLNYPLIVHSRNAEEPTMRTLEPYLQKGLKAILHCFTSGEELFNFGLQYGCYFSFNAITTFPKSDQLREIFIKTPLEWILIETDAPFLAPEPFRGKLNLPGYVSIIGEKLANIKGISPEKFQAITTANTKEFYYFHN